ncbi:peptidase M13 [Brevundimonas sp. BAL450]|uniref:Metallopeptidase n=1 Tax=Brevundimonas abyssalis TAR-001 TaxID=1391729 RepID=A0A8E0TSB8_9CAUL|nr:MULTISPECIES: M13-type metalloendopeptidase [Brevundimonas]MBG7614134.1 peptidase M13 [Brevundimonas sp. BAL450]GAD60337.1 metallopeptidase [Brevundimonas abyssalis TAR-001]
MKRLMIGAAVAALLLPAAAMADDGHDHECMNQSCTVVSLFQAPQLGATGYESIETPRYGTWGFDLEGRDTSVRPGDDFFRYANGTYVDNLEIPADRTRYGSFDLLSQLSENRMTALIAEISAAEDLAAGSDEAKVRDAYNSFMDVAAINALDAQPIQPMLSAIRAVDSHDAMAAYMGATQGAPGGSFWGTYISDDARDPEAYAVYLSQGGIGLPNRDYYLAENFAEKLAAYQVYVARMLEMAGWENAEQAAVDVVQMETAIATAHWTRIQSRDRDLTYNPMSTAELSAYAPGFDWSAYFEAAGLGEQDRFVVSQNTAFPEMARVFAEAPMETLRAWQAFHTVDQAAPYLSERFSDAQWEFRSRELTGAQAQRPRDKRGVSFAQGRLGEALGRLYVARWFPPEHRAQMEELVQNLKTAMGERIRNLDWMSEETRVRALDKLDKFGVKIGYPDEWRDYSDLDIQAGDLFGNYLRSGQWRWNYDLNRLGRPVDDAEWFMTPQTVNAYYSSTKNEIVFPAAILQPPFFDPDGDPAVNYGAIGGVIGHEIGHGFDDQGRKSDGDGRLEDWWTEEDAARFVAQTNILGSQYDSYEPIPGHFIQGALAMGENIGDLAGVTLGLEAYRVSLNGQEAPVLDGYTGDQRVFLGWAQVWRGLYRDDALRQQLAQGPHSPAEFRVIGPVRNVDAWYDAFDVQPGDRYYVAPEDRVRLW